MYYALVDMSFHYSFQTAHVQTSNQVFIKQYELHEKLVRFDKKEGASPADRLLSTYLDQYIILNHYGHN